MEEKSFLQEFKYALTHPKKYMRFIEFNGIALMFFILVIIFDNVINYSLNELLFFIIKTIGFYILIYVTILLNSIVDNKIMENNKKSVNNYKKISVNNYKKIYDLIDTIELSKEQKTEYSRLKDLDMEDCTIPSRAVKYLYDILKEKNLIN